MRVLVRMAGPPPPRFSQRRSRVLPARRLIRPLRRRNRDERPREACNPKSLAPGRRRARVRERYIFSSSPGHLGVPGRSLFILPFFVTISGYSDQHLILEASGERPTRRNGDLGEACDDIGCETLGSPGDKNAEDRESAEELAVARSDSNRNRVANRCYGSDISETPLTEKQQRLRQGSRGGEEHSGERSAGGCKIRDSRIGRGDHRDDLGRGEAFGRVM